MRRNLMLSLLFIFALPVISWSEDLHETQLNRGIRNSDAYSTLLIAQSHSNKAEAKKLLSRAQSFSPDLPEVYFSLAKESFSFSGFALFDSIDYLVQGINAFSRNFRWTFMFLASFALNIVFSFFLSVLVVIVLRLFLDVPLISHDIAESRAFVLALPVLLVLAVASPLLLCAWLLVLLGLYMRKTDRAVVYLFLAVLASFPLLFSFSSFLVKGVSSGNVTAITQVNESRDNNFALSILKNDSHPAAQFSYALALKREGRYDEAIKVYKDLMEKKPDTRIGVNLGNCYVGLYGFNEAKKEFLDEAQKYYSASAGMRPLASTYYNMSQVSREQLDFDKGNEYFKTALDLDRSAVSGFRAFSARTPQRIVADESLPNSIIFDYMREQSIKPLAFGISLVPVSFISLSSVLMIFCFFLLNHLVRQRAYRCKKCSTILCERCEKQLTWGQMCPSCYGSLVQLEALDVKERVSKLLMIYEKNKKRRIMLKVLSVIIPGTPQIYGGRIIQGFLLLWPFLFFLSVPISSNFFLPAHSWAVKSVYTLVSFSMAAVLYGISFLITRQRIAKGWL